MTPTNKNFDSKNPKRKRQSGKRSAKTKTTPSVEREEHEKAAEIVRQLARRHNRKKKSRLNATRHLGDYEVIKFKLLLSIFEIYGGDICYRMHDLDFVSFLSNDRFPNVYDWKIYFKRPNGCVILL